MARHAAIAIFLLVLMAGCVGKGKDADPSGEVAAAGTEAEAAASESDAAGSPTGAGAPEDAPLPLSVLLDGRTGTQAFACVFGPVGQCAAQGAGGESDLVFDGLRAAVVGGDVTLTWDAATPATQELSAGVMLMGGEGDACASLELAGASGPSPLALAVTPASRAICAGEVLHVWVSGGLYQANDAAYGQVDVDQAFHLEGVILLRAE